MAGIFNQNHPQNANDAHALVQMNNFSMLNVQKQRSQYVSAGSVFSRDIKMLQRENSP